MTARSRKSTTDQVTFDPHALASRSLVCTPPGYTRDSCNLWSKAEKESDGLYEHFIHNGVMSGGGPP